MRFAWLGLFACAGCLDGIDPSWQLDHDRIVVVRATPPHFASGEVATLDALVAHKGAPTDVESPLAAVGRGDLASAVSGTSVVGPDAATLDAARTAQGLPLGAPVPLEVAMEFAGSLLATKLVWLGDSQPNPQLGAVTVGGQPPGDAITVPRDVDVPLAIDVDPAATVSWLTSCGTLHDDNEHAAFVHVLPTDRQQGELAVVVRDPFGGVAWQVWPIAAQ